MNNGRAHIKAIAIANWRGIPFQIMEMDEYLTALEGKNAAGKTTVMSAFYLALMPDVSLVKILNIGDTEDSGRESSLHGKLGETGECYTILELHNAKGGRVVAGVQLLPKTAPIVEVGNMFVIKNLPTSVPIERVLIVEQGEQSILSNISSIQNQVGVYGGSIEIFKTASKYGDELFKQGILPIKLSDLKKRRNFNKLLQTSFQGGFSQHLQTRLKDYLLGEDKRIGESVARMQDNLVHCQKTKALLQSLQEKITSIKTVQSIGLEMLGGAIAGARLQYEEQQQNLSVLLKGRSEAKKLIARSELAKTRLEVDLKGAEESLRVGKMAFDEAKSHLEKAEKAHALAEKLSALQSELIPLKDQLAGAERAKIKAQTDYDSAAMALEVLHGQREDISSRLASAEEAWRQISREAGLYLAACECLAKAQAALPEANVSKDNARAILSECKEKDKQLGEESGALERKIKLASQGRKEFAEAHELLEKLCQSNVQESEAFDRALAIDGEYKALESLVASNADIGTKISDMQGKSRAQEAVRKEVEKLKSVGIYIETKDSFKAAHLRTIKELEDISSAEKSANIAIGDLSQTLIDVRNKKQACEAECHKFDEAISLRNLLSKKYLLDFSSRQEVDDTLSQEITNHRDLLGKRASLSLDLETVGESISVLAKNRTTLDGRYEKLEKALDGKLVATLYEDIELDEAGEKEARLGPLVKAIMVENVQAAIEKIDSLQDVPDEVWLVQKGNLDQELYRLKKTSSAIVAKMENAWRITQLPKFPTIGAKSRRKKMAALREQQDALRTDFTQCDKEISGKEQDIDSLRVLKSSFNIFEIENPQQKILKLKIEEETVSEKISKEKAFLKEQEGSRAEWLPMKETLDKWLPESYLLDETDYTGEVNKLVLLREEIGAAREKIGKNLPLLKALRSKTNNLKILPMSLDEAKGQGEELKRLMASWEFWGSAKARVGELVDKIDDFRYEERFNQKKSQEDPAESLRKEMAEITAKVAEISIKERATWKDRETAFAAYTTASSNFVQKDVEIVSCGNELGEIGIDGSLGTLEGAKLDFAKSESALAVFVQKKEGVEGEISSTKANIAETVRLKNNLQNDCLGAVKSFEPVRRAFRHAKRCVGLDRTLSKQWVSLGEVKEKFSRSEGAFALALARRGKLQGHFNKGLDGIGDEFHGEALSTKIEAMSDVYEDGAETRRIQDYLDLWSEIVSYISQILPRDIVHTDDPIEASQLMQERYESLAKILELQEKDFRSDSVDVSNSIRSRITEEGRSISKINGALDGVSFGNIGSIKIEFTRDQGMMSLLDAMQDQPQLFSEGIPLQDAMEKVYKQKTGGQVKGADLLDYSKYISLNIKVLRKSTQKWEPGSGLSTGEAIGTGATILSVILDSWEKTASFDKERDNDLRNSMRFLFMDEATRLDPDSIRTLLDFCKQMKIQLLIAGPKFEEEECGGGITYRLARKNFEGSEQVVIRGRKGFGGNFLEAPAA